MCGIAGIWQRDGRTVERRTAERFVGALAHRGPDGQGVLIEDDSRLALGHRRLAILDLSAAGAQPLRRGRYDITYNGEVYNFLELRAELESHGVEIRTDTDTEVVLAAFEQWGPACLPRFNGMWSFAIWDRHERRLFLARDRFGVKPLYIASTLGRVAFASELKAFLHLENFEIAADMAVVHARLMGRFDEGVLLRGVEAVPPGHCVEVTVGGSRCWRWWNTLDNLVSVPSSFAAQAEEFRALLFDACRLRLRSDVPLATSLSGGLDSASVLHAVAGVERSDQIARQAPDWRRAFIAGFPDTPQDETPYATLVARQTGATPVVRQFSGHELGEQLDTYLYQFEEIGGLFGVAAWALYREMRHLGVCVSLDGHGADELLGGYDVHVVLALLRGRGLAAAPRRTLDLLNTLRQLQPRGQRDRLPALVAALTIPGVRSVARRFPLARHEALWSILGRYSADATTATDGVSLDEERAIDALGPLTGALYRSFHRHSLPRILRNFDVHSMAHGVEVRMPMLDWRLVCYAFSLPDESKVGNGYTKRVLREAMRGAVPDEVRLRREKRGYNAPVTQWLTGGLSEWLWRQVNDPEFLRSELWDGRRLLAATRAKRESRMPWKPDEAHHITLAATAHWWLTSWLRARPPAVIAGS